MLCHQLGQNLILGLDLLLEVLDAFLLGLMIRAGFRLEGGCPVLEEFLLRIDDLARDSFDRALTLLD